QCGLFPACASATCTCSRIVRGTVCPPLSNASLSRSSAPLRLSAAMACCALATIGRHGKPDCGAFAGRVDEVWLGEVGGVAAAVLVVSEAEVGRRNCLYPA